MRRQAPPAPRRRPHPQTPTPASNRANAPAKHIQALRIGARCPAKPARAAPSSCWCGSTTKHDARTMAHVGFRRCRVAELGQPQRSSSVRPATARANPSPKRAALRPWAHSRLQTKLRHRFAGRRDRPRGPTLLITKGTTPTQPSPSKVSTSRHAGMCGRKAAGEIGQWANRRLCQLIVIIHGELGIGHGRCATILETARQSGRTTSWRTTSWRTASWRITS